MDEMDEMEEEGRHGRSSKSLVGVVLCCTSLSPERRAELSTRAEEMGAVHKLDLTSDVTHLLVGHTNTPKYKYVAKERPDVIVLRPEWVDAVRELWIQGEDMDIGALEEQYRLPVFSGLRICLTGFEDLAERQRLQGLVTENGAEYRGDLTKAVTHLVADKTDGEKYKFANLWGLKVVSIEWLNESLERGMILDEESYNPLMPKEERGKNAWMRTAPTSNLGKREREKAEHGGSLAEGPANRRKLRRTASAKLQIQSSRIWSDIAGNAARRRPSRTGLGTSNVPELAPEQGGQLALEEDRQDSNSIDAMPDAKRDLPPKSDKDEQRGMFFNQRMYVHGFPSPKRALLEKHILSNDGEIAPSLSDISCPAETDEHHKTYIIVPHDSRKDEQVPVTEMEPQPILATEWWIERCLHTKTLVDPAEHTTSRPFACFPIPDFDRLKICSTGFSDVEFMHLGKVVKLMGAVYEDWFTPHCSVIICNSPMQNKDKLRHAHNWGVPAVKIDWLWDSIRAGQKKSFDEYRIPDMIAADRIPDRRPKSANAPLDEPAARDSTKDVSNATRPAPKHQKPLPSKPRRKHARALTFETDLAEAANPPPLGDDGTRLSPQTPPVNPAGSQPLQDLEPEVNSDRKPSKTARAEPSNDQAVATSAPSADDLNAAIAALLARKQAVTAAARPHTDSAANGRRAPPSLRGRACSNLSTRAAEFSRTSSAESHHQQQQQLQGQEENGGGGVGTSGTGGIGSQVPEPSQKVMYKDRELQAQRERVIRKMGGTVAEPVGKGRSIGVVRDVGGGGVGTRTRLRTNGLAQGGSLKSAF